MRMRTSTVAFLALLTCTSTLVGETYQADPNSGPEKDPSTSTDENGEPSLTPEMDTLLNHESDVKPVFESDLPIVASDSDGPKYSSSIQYSGDDSEKEGNRENNTVDTISGASLEGQNGTLTGNGTALENDSNSTATNSTKPPKLIASCILRNMVPMEIDLSGTVKEESDPNGTLSLPEMEEVEASEDPTPTLEIVNVTQLIQDVLWTNVSIKNRTTPANCSVVLFFASWCPFSAKAAPHFNALPRAFPSLRIAAIDSSVHSSVNSYFGILSVPTILFFHNGKTIAKFNDTLFTLNRFAEFIQSNSELRSDENINVTSQDFLGPLPSTPSKEIDLWLVLAWIFIIICFFHYASKSVLWKKVIDLVRTTWREAEDQHEHAD